MGNANLEATMRYPREYLSRLKELADASALLLEHRSTGHTCLVSLVDNLLDMVEMVENGTDSKEALCAERLLREWLANAHRRDLDLFLNHGHLDTKTIVRVSRYACGMLSFMAGPSDRKRDSFRRAAIKLCEAASTALEDELISHEAERAEAEPASTPVLALPPPAKIKGDNILPFVRPAKAAH